MGARLGRQYLLGEGLFPFPPTPPTCVLPRQGEGVGKDGPHTISSHTLAPMPSTGRVRVGVKGERGLYAFSRQKIRRHLSGQHRSHSRGGQASRVRPRPRRKGRGRGL